MEKGPVILMILLILISASSSYAIETEAILKDEHLIDSTEELIEVFKLQSQN